MSLPDSVPIRLKLRNLVLGFTDRDICENNAVLAEQLFREITTMKDMQSCLQETLGGWEQPPNTSATRRLRARVACTGVAQYDYFNITALGIVIKQLHAILAIEKNEATLAEMASLMRHTARTVMQLPPHELEVEESNEPFLTRKMIMPLLKAGISGAGKDRAPAACTIVEGVLQECQAQKQQPQAVETSIDFLKFILQNQATGNMPVAVVEAYAPIRTALTTLGCNTPAPIIRRATGVCMQALKCKESWAARKQAALTITTLSNALLVYEHTPQMTKRLRRAPALLEMVSQKVGLMSALDSVKYDKIAQVREAVAKAIGDLSTVPDELEEEQEPTPPSPSPPPSQQTHTAPKHTQNTPTNTSVPISPTPSPQDGKKKDRSRSMSFSKGFAKLKSAIKGKHSTSDGESPPNSPKRPSNLSQPNPTSRLARQSSSSDVVEVYGPPPPAAVKKAETAAKNAEIAAKKAEAERKKAEKAELAAKKAELATQKAPGKPRGAAQTASGEGGGEDGEESFPDVIILEPPPRGTKGRTPARPPLSRFRQRSNMASGGKFDVAVEVFAPPSPKHQPHRSGDASSEEYVQEGVQTDPSDRGPTDEDTAASHISAANDETQTSVSPAMQSPSRVSSTGIPQGGPRGPANSASPQRVPYPSGSEIQSGVAPHMPQGMVAGQFPAMSAFSAAGPFQGGSAVPAQGPLPMDPAQFAAAMQNMNPLMLQQLQMQQQAYMQAMMAQMQQQMQQQLAMGMGMPGMAMPNLMGFPGMQMPAMQMPMQMPSMPDAPAAAMQQQPAGGLGSHSRQNSGMWTFAPVFVPAQPGAVPGNVTGADVTGAVESAAEAASSKASPAKTGPPRAEGSRIPSPLKPSSAAAAPAAASETAGATASVEVYSNPLYKLGKLSIKGSPAKVPAETAEDSPNVGKATASESEGMPSSPDTGRYRTPHPVLRNVGDENTDANTAA